MAIFIKVLAVVLLLVIAAGLVALICRLQMKYPSIFCEYYPDYSELLKRPGHGKKEGSDEEKEDKEKS